MSSAPRVVIIGAGFAGLKLARTLCNTPYEVLLIDKVNHHQFQPLLYQVASAELEPSSISFPLRDIFHGVKNVRIRMEEVHEVNTAENKVITNIATHPYDYLVIATGATTNFFGNANLTQFTMPMKSTSEAIEIRQRILMNFEMAIYASPEERKGLMSVAIVGGGPTGVELAGALAEMRRHVLWKDYPELDFRMMKIMLLEGSAQTLNTMSDQASAKSKAYLEQLGVEVWLQTQVKDYDGKHILLVDGKTIRTNTVVWAAGITGNVPAGLNPENIQRGNRISVDRFNRMTGFDNIYVLGDIASMVTPKYPKGHPQVANVAINQAANLGKNLKRMLRQKPLTEFEYHDKGSLATVGKHKAVVDLSFIKFQGFFAWWVWMSIHLLLLMGMKNRLFVFINWVIAYFTNNSTLRLIFRPKK